VWLSWQWALVLAAGMGAASVAARRQGRRWDLAADFFTQVSLIAALYSLWQLIASYADGRAKGAVHHGLWVWRVERDLYWPSEAWMQRLVLHHRLLVEASNVFYAGVHVPALGIFLVWLFVRHRAQFARYRDALAVLTLLCLLAYLVPVAPPRLLPKLGLVDTGLLYHQSVYGRPGTGIADQLSAMPSVHMAWALFIALTVVQVSRSRWRWLIVAHPVATMLVVVVTANHYWLDGAAAAVLLLVAVWVSGFIDRLRLRRARGQLARTRSPASAAAELSPSVQVAAGPGVRQDA
jgi:hypothetical protein